MSQGGLGKLENTFWFGGFFFSLLCPREMGGSESCLLTFLQLTLKVLVLLFLEAIR